MPIGEFARGDFRDMIEEINVRSWPMKDGQYSPYRWVLQSILLVLQIGLGLNFMAPTPLFTLIMEDYGLSKASVSLLVSTVLFVLTISLLPGGLLVSRIGSRKAIAVCGVFLSVGLFTPLTASFLLLVVVRLVFGVGVAISLSATSAFIMEWFKPSEFSILNGINETGRAIGVSLGVAVAVPIANLLGWQMTFFAYSLLVVVAILLWVTTGWVSNTRKFTEAPMALRDNIPLIFNRNTLVLSLGAMGPFCVFIGYSAWLPTYYSDIQGMTLEQAGRVVAVLPLVAAIMNPISGIAQTKLGRRKPVLIACGAMFPIFAIGSILMTNTLAILVCVMCLGGLFSMFIVAVLTIPMELPGVTAGRVAIVTAAVLTVGNAAAGFSPIFIGSLTDMLGSYWPALLVVAVMPTTLLIPGVILPETGPKGGRDGSASPSNTF